MRPFVKNELINVEVGYFSRATKRGFLAEPGKHYRRDRIFQLSESHTFHKDLPLTPAVDPQGGNALVCKVWTQEEKGSDVNLATHLIRDVTSGLIDIALVITNDGDQALPLRIAREQVRVITVNPAAKETSRPLMGTNDASRRQHAWLRLSLRDFQEAQLADQVGEIRRPETW